MKKLKNFTKIIVISFSILFSVLTVSAVSFYHISTKGVSLNTQKIESANENQLKIYDKNLNEINLSNKASVSINKLNKHTKDAFVSAEDKRFYSHKGIDYIRVGGAIISNLKTKSFSEGASTISQQLIKNTQLSSEKTINRKLKEIKLARALEQNYSKDEILEMYLNNIYFGNGNYGIENASNYYFGKSSKDLTLAESALLAGTINAPSIYNIENHTEKAKTRRNLILSIMHSQDKIDETELNNALNEEIKLNLKKQSNNNYMFNEIINEACAILKINENKLKNSDIEIYTNYNSSLSDSINNLIKNNYKNLANLNTASLVIDNETGTIISVIGDTKTLQSKKQPGSTIKPILVYAPAIENGIITPDTKILDEKIDISGYSPENADGKYHGFVSAKECLKNSYNIPAVKLLNEIGISTAQNFAKKLNIEFTDNDNHLAIALGGFSEGTTIKQLADSYMAFANNGEFSPSKYITEIKINNKTKYKKNNARQSVMKASTAKLITDMLIETSKTGTAKKLNSLSYEIASKTGTVGKKNSSKNTDAYSISYTTEHTVLTYIGGNELNSNINGSSYPTMINKNIFELLYSSYKPKNFTNKNNENMANNMFQKNSSNNFANSNNLTNLLTAQNPNNQNLPNLTLSALNLKNNKPILIFEANENYTYNIIRKQNNKEEIISSLQNVKQPKIIKFVDISAKNSQIYEYLVEICEKSTTKKYQTNTIKLKTFD